EHIEKQQPRMVSEEQTPIREVCAHAQPPVHQRRGGRAEGGYPIPCGGPSALWRVTLPDIPRHALLQGQESLQDQCRHGVLAPARRKEVLHWAIPSPGAWAMFCRCGHLASRSGDTQQGPKGYRFPAPGLETGQRERVESGG